MAPKDRVRVRKVEPTELETAANILAAYDAEPVFETEVLVGDKWLPTGWPSPNGAVAEVYAHNVRAALEMNGPSNGGQEDDDE